MFPPMFLLFRGQLNSSSSLWVELSLPRFSSLELFGFHELFVPPERVELIPEFPSGVELYAPQIYLAPLEPLELFIRALQGLSTSIMFKFDSSRDSNQCPNFGQGF